MKYDVVVVGGGPAGSSAAIRLARDGFDVCLVDRSRFPRAKPCGEFLSPGATPILEDLGARDAVEAAGALRIGRVRIVAHGSLAELDVPDDLGTPPWGFSLSRRALDALLLDAARAAGAEVIEGHRVDEIRLEPGRAVALSRDRDGAPLALESRIVIGAGGRNCPVARALGVQRRDPRARFDLLAHWSGGRRGSSGDSGAPVCELTVRGDRYSAVAPIEGGRWNVNCVVSRAALRVEPDPAALYRRVVAAANPPAGEPDEAVVASDVTPLCTRRATADRALLIGDAALFLDPFTGQGVYLALRSAELAAPIVAAALRGRRSDRTSLAGYDAARGVEFDARRRVSRALQAVLYRPRAARAVVGALARNRDLARALAAATGDLTPSETVWSTGFALRLAAAGLIRT